MTLKPWIVAALLRLYPAAWRVEYGSELTDILLARPLSARAIGDVVWSGLRQRALAAEPSTILGVASMLIILGAFTVAGDDSTAVLRPSAKTFPTLTVRFLASGFYSLLLIGCGYWTHLRRGGPAKRAGVAGMKMSLIAGMPIIIGALLMMLGLVGASGPHLPSAWSILVAPLARLPEAWLWGSIGGLAGKCLVSRSIASAAASGGASSAGPD